MEMPVSMVDVARELKSPYDYDHYCVICERDKLKPIAKAPFCSMLGMVYGSRLLYPEMDWDTAYRKLMSEQDAAPPVLDVKPVEQSRSCCGGGSVK